MEGRDQVRDMLKARLPDVKPSSWKIADGEDATEANGVLESWIEFETDVARGNGHIRVKNGQILDAFNNYVGTQGTRGAAGLQ